jgi:hypothetical protein
MMRSLAALFALNSPQRQRFEASIAGRRFVFEFVSQRNGEIRMYIDRQPNYGGRASDLQSTHRYFEKGRYYVCVRSDLVPKNFAEARDWATYFASKTVDYIDTGRLFS